MKCKKGKSSEPQELFLNEFPTEAATAKTGRTASMNSSNLESQAILFHPKVLQLAQRVHSTVKSAVYAQIRQASSSATMLNTTS